MVSFISHQPQVNFNYPMLQKLNPYAKKLMHVSLQWASDFPMLRNPKGGWFWLTLEFQGWVVMEN